MYKSTQVELFFPSFAEEDIEIICVPIVFLWDRGGGRRGAGGGGAWGGGGGAFCVAPFSFCCSGFLYTFAFNIRKLECC